MKPQRTSYWTCWLGVSVFLLVSGLTLLCVWPVILKYILERKLVLTPDSEIYGPWSKTPFFVPLEYYLFNWTNPEDIVKKNVKPKVEQVGPYRYWEDYQKSNITWNDNGTVTFRHLKFWHYDEDESNGDIKKNVTIINPVLLTAAHALKSWNYFARLGFSFALSSNLTITNTVENLLFNGVKEPIIDAANTMSFLTGKMPYDKFGFSYKMNGSIDFDGVFNMGTGINSTFGEIYSWNYMTQTPYFKESCSKVNGSAGDFFQAREDFITFYVPYLCRTMVLKNVGKKKVKGILGYKYVLEDMMLDNGTIYPQNTCYCNGGCIPSGLINISVCNYDAPMFLSLPHFYRADPYYVNLVEGLNPNGEKHEFSMTLEPVTGFTLEADAKLQLNVLLQPVYGVTRLAHVPKIYFPLMWTRHKVEIPDADASKLKLLMSMQTAFSSCGIIIIATGLSFLCYTFYKKCTNHVPPDSKQNDIQKEQTLPLKCK